MNKADLIQCLERVKPGLSNKEMIEQSTSFAFIEGRVVTYNDEISISHPVPGLGDVTGAIKADELYKLLSKLSEDDIEVSVSGPEVILKAGRSKAGFTLQTEIKLPLDEVPAPSKWKDVPDGFLEAIRFTSSSCSRDMSRPVLTCLNVRDSGVVEASDNLRITNYDLGNKMPVPTFLLPVTSAKEILAYKINKICKSDGWIHFKTNEDTILSCRIFEDKFPDVSKFFDVEGDEIKLPKDLHSALDKASVFAVDGEIMSVTLTLKPKKMIVRGRSTSGWFEEEMPARYNGKEITFTTCPKTLQDITSQTTTCILGKNVMLFAGDKWKHVVSLAEG